MNKRKERIKLLPILIIIVIVLFVLSYFDKEKVITTMKVNNWGLSFQEKNTCPVIDIDKKELEVSEAYHLGKENKIYLTFDAGFENGNTEKILEALKKNNVKACFFLVGNYLEKEPELVKKIVAEGHIVGNHTYHHKDMATLNSKEEFIKELEDMEILYRNITSSDMDKFYRPPQGKFTMEQLQWAKEAGYKSIFWSLAYVDWEVDNQPSKEEAIEKLKERIHPGAIVLLHSTSQTNAEIMDEIICEWKSMGYEFGTLDEL